VRTLDVGKGVSLVALVVGALIAPGTPPEHAAEADGAADARRTRLVDPFIGTDPRGAGDNGGGNTFPGPVMPNGMIRLGPDTFPGPADGGGGYSYADTRMRGFSLTRLSGTGCPVFGDVPITPTTRPITSSPVDAGSRDVREEFMSRFSHDTEVATPGYYGVDLVEGSGEEIGVQLTSAPRSAVARFTFPEGREAGLLVNTAGSRSAKPSSDVSVAIDPARREITGSTVAGGLCAPDSSRYTLHFVIRFDRPFASFGTWQQQALALGSTAANDPAQAGGYLTFDTTSASRVEARVGISFVSVAGARANLDTELSGLTFREIRSGARDAWEDVLGLVEVSGGPEAARRRFSTALYHSQIEPGVFSDADGRYPGMEDGETHTAVGRVQYANFDLWGAYRSQLPLTAMVRPEVASDIAQSLVAAAGESGWLPKWSVANHHTWIMTGDSASPALAGVYALGARDFDATGALAAMVKGATQTGQSPRGYVERQALADYLAHGYVPHERNGTRSGPLPYAWPSFWETFGLPAPVPGAEHIADPWGSAGTTLEYSLDDFAVAQLARALGDTGTCEAFLARSGSWRHLVNPDSGFVEPRRADGSFLVGYDPAANDGGAFPGDGVNGFAEGTAAQYTWMVPHDPAGLFGALGRPEAALERLDAATAELDSGWVSEHVNLGNEPGAGTPWLYNWAGRPDRTQEVVRRALTELYPSDTAGFPGNDDLGQMSAWYVLGAVGLYPAVPGTDILALGTPLFPSVTLHLPGGAVEIRARGAATDPYIRELRIDGRVHERSWVRFGDLASGARLEYGLAGEPDASWARGPEAVPPSFAPDSSDGCAGL